ncbi:FbpB family small basic protein [Bacillus sp. V2I10]|uniref:FbpB family small basic protein n=1 Tax=Bacillus sp. V2I10 TaxID=3042276 RepID=UPI00277FEEBC|nr:FbpB family small basic protein [Bacillus sp. V2I10]MDQ0862186.1 hypothetical protein [Bacillus sp. V2I10]
MGAILRNAVENRKKFIISQLQQLGTDMETEEKLYELCLSDLEREFRHVIEEEKMMRKKNFKELVDENKRSISEDPDLLEEIYTKIDNKRAGSTNIKSQKVDK